MKYFTMVVPQESGQLPVSRPLGYGMRFDGMNPTASEVGNSVQYFFAAFENEKNKRSFDIFWGRKTEKILIFQSVMSHGCRIFWASPASVRWIISCVLKFISNFSCEFTR